MRFNQRGAALLLELMMVVSIVAILAMLAVPSYLNHRALQQAQQVLGTLTKVRTDVATNALCTNTLPQSLNNLPVVNYNVSASNTQQFCQTLVITPGKLGCYGNHAGWNFSANSPYSSPANNGWCCPPGSWWSDGAGSCVNSQANYVPGQASSTQGQPTGGYPEQASYGPLVSCLTMANGCTGGNGTAGQLIAVFSTRALSPLAGKALVLTPTLQTGGGVTWQCSIPGSLIAISPNC